MGRVVQGRVVFGTQYTIFMQIVDNHSYLPSQFCLSHENELKTMSSEKFENLEDDLSSTLDKLRPNVSGLSRETGGKSVKIVE